MWNTLSRTEKDNLLKKWQKDAMQLLKQEGISGLSGGNLRKYYLKGYIAERKEQLIQGDQYGEFDDGWYNHKTKLKVKELKGKGAYHISKGDTNDESLPVYIRIDKFNFFYKTIAERDADYRRVTSILVSKRLTVNT